MTPLWWDNNNDESNYRDNVSQLAVWCRDNNLSLNVEKTKEIVVNFRRALTHHPPLTINSDAVERVSSTKFLGVNCNLNTLFCQTHLLCQGNFMNVKLPLIPKYCLFIYFCYNTLYIIMPNLTGV